MYLKIINLVGDDTWHPCSPEFINYALALVVYSVRYPAVFWNTNKAFSFMFSAQVIIIDVQRECLINSVALIFRYDAKLNFISLYLAFGQLISKPDGIGWILCHVQSTGSGSSECVAQIRTLLVKQTDLHITLRFGMYNCDHLILRTLYVWIPKGNAEKC